ncbi:MAG: ribosome recycling factor [Planctomycetota bacterium]|jgi:ribosome recycling factor
MSLSYQAYLDDAQERMDKTVEHFQDETRGFRTGRASAGLIENIRVDYYGTKTPLSQMAAITVPEPRCLLVKPFDPSGLKDIEKAILAADLGLNPSIDGNALRVTVPHLSEDQRKKMVARLKSLAEDTKVSLRNVRRDVIKEVEHAQKDKTGDVAVTEDDVKSAKSDIQDILKNHEAGVEATLDSKSTEILEI